MKSIAVETKQLTKYYSSGKIIALEDCSLQVEQGKIFSLLGPNGAGKSTLIKILLGIVYPTSGSALVKGLPISDHKMHKNIGYLAENHRFPEFLSAYKVLFYYGKMNGIPVGDLPGKIFGLLKKLKLEKWANEKIRKFSKGMLQRLGLAHAMLHDPDILFLDEPTDGIDPVGRREIRDLLSELRNRGKTIFLNSHLLSEVERVSDEIAVMKSGKIIRRGTLDEFTSVHNQYRLTCTASNNQLDSLFKSIGIEYVQNHDSVLVNVSDDLHLNRLIDQLRSAEIVIQSTVPQKLSLEDYFIKVVTDEGGQN